MEGIDHIGQSTKLISLVSIQSHLHQLLLLSRIYQPITRHVHAYHLEVGIQLCLDEEVNEFIVFSVHLQMHLLLSIVKWVLKVLILAVELDVAIEVANDKVLLLDGLDVGDVEVVTWGVHQPNLEVSIRVKEEDVSCVGAYYQISPNKNMACIVVRVQLTLLLRDALMAHLEVVVVSHSVIFVAVLTCD